MYFENKSLRDWCNDLGIAPPDETQKKACVQSP